MERGIRWAGLAIVLSVAVASTAVRADDAELTGDLKKLQGTWTNAGSDGPDSTWKFDGEKVKATVNGDDYSCSIKLDEKAEPHASIDVTIKDGPDDSKGKTVKGIYKFEGKKLHLCVAMPGQDSRPKSFESIESESHHFQLEKE